MDIEKVHISKVVAETFFEDHVLEWKATGLVPKQLLLQPSAMNPLANPPALVDRVRKEILLPYFAVERICFFCFFLQHAYSNSLQRT